MRPDNSNHLNGVIFEKSASGRSQDPSFLGIAQSCQFLARYHHNENNLKTLAEKYTNLLDYATLKKLTQLPGTENFNSVYGSKYDDISPDFRFPFPDWIDDYDKTSSFVNLKIGDYMPPDSSESGFVGDRDELKYKYNLGQAHAIDDFDEDSVWFYITMVSPLEELDSVVELEDIMPYVFWWENRGLENNGPDVDCYGLASSSKLNYEQGGWCYSLAHEGLLDDVWVDQTLDPPERHNPRIGAEHRWHAVSNTLGVDFSKNEYGGTLLTTDNSGNVYKGAFDPNCSGTDEKWKIHHLSNAFGANQHEDPTSDKYYFADKAHGDTPFPTKVTPATLNDYIMDSINDRPMTWNLWNVIRHYVYIKYFKNRHRSLGTDESAWADLEKYTKKLVKGIYRTFKDNKFNEDDTRSTFGSMNDTSTNYGEKCQVHWTNSFIEVSTILERNAREHRASFVLFTGNVEKHPLDSDAVTNEQSRLDDLYQNTYGIKDMFISQKMAQTSLTYKEIMNSHDSFRITTNEGVDADDTEDGMIPRTREVEYTLNGNEVSWGKNSAFKTTLVDNKFTEYGVECTVSGSQVTWIGGSCDIIDGKFKVVYNNWIPNPNEVYDLDHRIFQGFKYSDLPTTYLIGDGVVYSQRQQDIDASFKDIVDLDKLYPESEYYVNDSLRKWVRKIRGTVLNR